MAGDVSWGNQFSILGCPGSKNFGVEVVDGIQGIWVSRQNLGPERLLEAAEGRCEWKEVARPAWGQPRPDLSHLHSYIPGKS